MWIEFTEDKSVKWSRSVTQDFKAGARFNCPHEKAQELIAEGVAKEAKATRKETKIDPEEASVTDDVDGLLE